MKYYIFCGEIHTIIFYLWNFLWKAEFLEISFSKKFAMHVFHYLHAYSQVLFKNISYIINQTFHF